MVMIKKCLVDLIVTENCNNNCMYCVQRGMHTDKKINIVDVDKIFTFMNKLKKENEYNLMELMLFGGEPLLYEDIANEIFDRTLNNDNKLIIITNGLNLPKYINKLEKLSNNNKLILQISYDGQPIHDQCRCNTSETVINSIDLLRKYNIPYHIKPTLPINKIEYMYDAFTDVIKYCDNYNPTVDYSDIKLSNEELLYYCDEIKRQIMKISKYCLLHNNPKLFPWFFTKKPLCRAGVDYVSVDTKLNLSYCHGCIYSKYANDYIIGNINDDNIINKVKDSFYTMNSITYDEPLICKECNSVICKRCRTTNADNSRGDTFKVRWNDKNSYHLCALYKAASIPIIAFNNVIQNRR